MAIELAELLVPDATTWRAWLLEHHASSPGVWLVLHKKGGATTALTYELAVQEALCFGWIDGQARSRDAESSLQRMTPRRPRSAWSVRNVERVARLELAGRMHDAGRAQVRAAQEDGRWQRPYAGQADAVVPEDLAAALSADPAAQAWFEVLTAANRFAVLYRVQAAIRPETWSRRISELVAGLARGETPHPQKRRPEARIG